MKKDNRIYIVISIIGMIAVIWLALIIAPITNGGLATIINELPAKLQRPFNITICEDSSKTVLIFLLSYLIGIGAYFQQEKIIEKAKNTVQQNGVTQKKSIKNISNYQKVKIEF